MRSKIGVAIIVLARPNARYAHAQNQTNVPAEINKTAPISTNWMMTWIIRFRISLRVRLSKLLVCMAQPSLFIAARIFHATIIVPLYCEKP
jgi:hypothetical protein